jgi:hypothetical protein
VIISCEHISGYQVSGVVCPKPRSRHLHATDSTDELDKRAPISVKFEIPYFTVSGIQVRYLKVVEKSGYQAVSVYSCLRLTILVLITQLPWVRYITQNGDDFVSPATLLR